MTENEQALLAELRDIADDLDAKKSHWSANRIRDALALLDAKDEELSGERAAKEWLILKREEAEAERDAKDAEIADRDRRIADLAHERDNAEAALAEERKAHQAMQAAIVEAVRHFEGTSREDWHSVACTMAAYLHPFLPAKPAADPLVEPLRIIMKKFGHDLTDEQLLAIRDAAIERSGGTISFERNW